MRVPDFIAASVAFHDLEAMPGTFKSGARNRMARPNAAVGIAPFMHSCPERSYSDAVTAAGADG